MLQSEEVEQIVETLTATVTFENEEEDRRFTVKLPQTLKRSLSRTASTKSLNPARQTGYA